MMIEIILVLLSLNVVCSLGDECRVDNLENIIASQVDKFISHLDDDIFKNILDEPLLFEANELIKELKESLHEFEDLSNLEASIQRDIAHSEEDLDNLKVQVILLENSLNHSINDADDKLYDIAALMNGATINHSETTSPYQQRRNIEISYSKHNPLAKACEMIISGRDFVIDKLFDFLEIVQLNQFLQKFFNLKFNSKLNLPFNKNGLNLRSNAPENAITKDISLGSCYACSTNDFPCVLSINLAKEVMVNEIKKIVVEHIKPMNAVNINSAPNLIKIYSEHDLLAELNYTIENGSPSEQDAVLVCKKDSLIVHQLRIEIFSNHGNEHFVCLYGIRVFV